MHQIFLSLPIYDGSSFLIFPEKSPEKPTFCLTIVPDTGTSSVLYLCKDME